jgi:hypothetical protein
LLTEPCKHVDEDERKVEEIIIKLAGLVIPSFERSRRDKKVS